MTGQAATGALALAVKRSMQVDIVDAQPGAITRAGRHFQDTFSGRTARIVADENTWAAAGPALEGALVSSGIACERVILSGTPRPKPRKELADELATQADPSEIFVALGSGVINDLVKYAAHRNGARYMSVATAASMDGYTSAGAPLSEAGFKITIPCRAPKVIVADPDILAAAPEQMLGWGYGDLVGKLPAGADWILADALKVEAIDTVAWPMVQERLPDWVGLSGNLAIKDRGALATLFEGLSMVGLAMEVYGSSRPASGADHQIAHFWEMEDLHWRGERVSHGACVAVASIAVLKLYAWLLAQDFTTVDVTACVARIPTEAQFDAVLAAQFETPEFRQRARAESLSKLPTPDVLTVRLTTLAEVWPDLRSRLGAHLAPAADLGAHLRTVGAPAATEEIGVSQEKLRRTIEAARFIRSRYTILDLLAETGLLETALDAVFPLERTP